MSSHNQAFIVKTEPISNVVFQTVNFDFNVISVLKLISPKLIIVNIVTAPYSKKKRVTNCLNSIILMVYVKLLVQFHLKFHVRFRNYDHLKHGPFRLDTEPLKFLSFSTCFYLAIFSRKRLKFGLVIYFHEIIP